ncbi:MAG TPA: AraC family transcriptional regulator, partial [Verrucomicrobiae bacterium]
MKPKSVRAIKAASSRDRGELGRPIQPEFISAGRLDHKGISRSLQYLAQNFMRPIQLADVVSASGMSRRGFIKAFGQYVGSTPGAFMRQARIEFAKRLLIEQDLSLKTLA